MICYNYSTELCLCEKKPKYLSSLNEPLSCAIRFILKEIFSTNSLEGKAKKKKSINLL